MTLDQQSILIDLMLEYFKVATQEERDEILEKSRDLYAIYLRDQEITKQIHHAAALSQMG